jgi:ribosomal protein S15P/S13E
MTTKKEEVNHVELYEWLKALDFYKNELKFWRNRLSEVVSRNSSKEILRSAEHFQNQVIIQEENIDILRHDIKQFENHLEDWFEAHPKLDNEKLLNIEGQLRERMKIFEHIYVDLKHEYYSYLRQYM